MVRLKSYLIIVVKKPQ